jgi:hypothetical protein
MELQGMEDSLPPRTRFKKIAHFAETYRDISILVDRQVTSEQGSDLIFRTG